MKCPVPSSLSYLAMDECESLSRKVDGVHGLSIVCSAPKSPHSPPPNPGSFCWHFHPFRHCLRGLDLDDGSLVLLPSPPLSTMAQNRITHHQQQPQAMVPERFHSLYWPSRLKVHFQTLHGCRNRGQWLLPVMKFHESNEEFPKFQKLFHRFSVDYIVNGHRVRCPISTLFFISSIVVNSLNTGNRSPSDPQIGVHIIPTRSSLPPSRAKK